MTATPQPDGGLVLAAPERPDLRVPSVGGNRSVEVTLSRVATALDAGDSVATWLSEWLGLPVGLVWLDDPTRRTVSPDHGGALGDVLNLADAGPIHLTSTTSLARLNDWLLETAMDRGEDPPDPLPMVRFRPGVVVDDVAEPFVEDEWRRVMIGSTELRFSEHCDRCVLPTIDPVTLTSTHEPTRTLARHRQWDHKVHFGVRLVPVTTGTLRVGDEVRPI